jgi:hypothetical protein
MLSYKSPKISISKVMGLLFMGIILQTTISNNSYKTMGAVNTKIYLLYQL